MSNNFYQPKNEFGKALVPVSTPKGVGGGGTEEFIDLSWLRHQDDLSFNADQEMQKQTLVTAKALKDLQEQIKGKIQFKFILVESEAALPDKITDANIDDLRTSIYIVALTGTNKETGINEYAEYVCTNTAEFTSDTATPSVTPKFERFGIGVAKATDSVQGAVTLSDTADTTKDVASGVAATPKAVAAAQAAAEAKAKAVSDALAALEAKHNTLEGTVNGHTTKIGEIETAIAGLDDLESDVEDLKETVEGLEGDVGSLKPDVAAAQKDITDLQGDVTDLQDKVAGMEEAAEGVAVVGTMSLSVPTTGSVKADFPLESSLVRFEVIKDGVATNLYPGVTYATAGDKKQEITLTFWSGTQEAITVKAHYVTTKAKAALFAEPDSDPEEEEEQGGAGDGQDEGDSQD